MNFNQQCYDLISQIPKGNLCTYKQIADCLNTKAYRQVGKVMSKNPDPIIVPCHRVINSNGLVGGFSLGFDIKIILLKNEGIKIKKGKVVDYKKYLYSFK